MNRSQTRILCAVAAACALALSACQTCVTGEVWLDGVPGENLLVELLDEQGNHLAGSWVMPNGVYCFNDVPLNRTLAVRVCQGETCQEQTFQSGAQPARCGGDLCVDVDDIHLACSPPDPLEPNNTCQTASPVELPYTNPLTGLCPAGDVDFYEFQVATEGKTLVAQVFYPDTGPYVDALLGLMDSDCNILATSNDTGAWFFEYPLIPPGTYRIAVTGYWDHLFQGLHWELGAYGLDIRLADPSCVDVRVTQQGDPLEGAWVYANRAPYHSCQTRSSGACCFEAFVGIDAGYSICHPESGECVDVAATPTLAGSCTQGGCEEIRFDFNYTCVSGTITREGEPVGGAGVELHCAGGFFPWVESAPDGTFCLLAPPDSACTVTVRDPLFWNPDPPEISIVTGSGGSCAEGGCTEVPLELPGITCVSGTVIRGDDPVEGLEVCSAWGCFVTDPWGHYCFDAPKASEGTVGVWDPSTGTFLEQTVQTGDTGSCEEGGCTEVLFELPAAACIQGTITREGGLPAQGVRVCVMQSSNCVDTDAQGDYCIHAPVQSDVDLQSYDLATGDLRSAPLRTGGEGSCITGGCTEFHMDSLPPVACISVFVLRGDDPQEGVDVCTFGYGSACGTTDGEGVVCVARRTDSHAYLEAYDPVLNQYVWEYVLTGGPGACPDSGCSQVTFQFQETSCVSGVVREGAAPLPGAMVTNTYTSTYTDEEGRYCLPAEANREAWIRAEHPSDGSWIQRYPTTGSGGSCEEGGCTTQNFTFDLKLGR